MNAMKAVDFLRKSSRPITVLIDEKAIRLFHQLYSEGSDAKFLGEYVFIFWLWQQIALGMYNRLLAI
jgi:hypothetical protein